MTKAILQQLRTPFEVVIILLAFYWAHEVGDANFTIQVATTASIMLFITLVSWSITLWYIIHTLKVFHQHRHQATWRGNLRNIFWMALLGCVGSLLIVLFATGSDVIVDRVRSVEIIIPLIMGIQMAFAFSPLDEPSLETSLAFPRPVAWILLERYTLILLFQSIIALFGIILSFALIDGQDVIITLVRWIPPTIFFGSIGAYATLRSQTPAFGVVVVGIVWGLFNFFAQQLLPGAIFPSPLNYIQPFLWTVAAYLQPNDLLEVSYYWLNRALLLSLGFNFLILTVIALRDEEKILQSTK